MLIENIKNNWKTDILRDYYTIIPHVMSIDSI